VQVSKFIDRNCEPFFAKTLLLDLVLAAFAATADCYPAPEGIVRFWKGDSNVFDSVSLSSGALVGHAGFDTGKVGQAFSLAGTDSAVSLANSNAYHLQDLTIEAWIKRANASQPSQSSPFGTILGGGFNNFTLTVLESGRLTFSKVGVSRIDSSVAITDVEWHHIAVTKGGSNVAFYIDGQPAGSGVFNSVFSFETPLSIGALSQSYAGVGTEPFWGLIDEVSLYRRPLSGSEIASIYAAGSEGKCVQPSAPTIIEAPADQNVPNRQDATFRVIAVGSGTLTYQWKYDGADIPDATHSTLILPSVHRSANGSYGVTVCNAVGCAPQRRPS
jgi:hypothetical protein